MKTYSELIEWLNEDVSLRPKVPRVPKLPKLPKLPKVIGNKNAARHAKAAAKAQILRTIPHLTALFRHLSSEK